MTLMMYMYALNHAFCNLAVMSSTVPSRDLICKSTYDTKCCNYKTSYECYKPGFVLGCCGKRKEDGTGAALIFSFIYLLKQPKTSKSVSIPHL